MQSAKIGKSYRIENAYPDSKVHGANMGPTWVLSAPDGPHFGPMNLAIRVALLVPVKAQVESQLSDMYSLRMLPFLTRQHLIKNPRIKSEGPFTNTV